MEFLSFSIFALLIGIRHGLDGDHVAAIANMVGSEKKKRKQVSLGILYAIGHGSIVFLIGLVSIYIGLELSSDTKRALEVLVSITLMILGVVILYSLLKNKKEYEYRSRLQIILKFLHSTASRWKLKIGGKGFAPVHLGLTSAFVIGLIHGIGVESPTQITVITSATGLDNASFATLQLILFVVGLLISTVLMTFFLSWGFIKARMRRTLFLILGTITGTYSLGLGTMMILEIFKGGI